MHFGNVNGPNPTAAGQISTHPKSSVWIFAPLINLGGTWTKGIDATVEYEWDSKGFGLFDIKSDATIYDSYTFQEVPTQPYYGYVGQVSQNLGTVPRWRTFTTLEWTYKGFKADIDNTYVPSVSDVGSGGATASAPVAVASYSQFDVSLKYDFSKAHFGKYLDGFSVRLGINNVFNKYPPVALNAEPDTNADVGFYGGAVGREMYVDVGYKF